MTNPIPHRCKRGQRCNRCAYNAANGGVANHPQPALVKAATANTVASCVHLGADTGRRESCRTCGGKVELKVLACAVHGECTVAKKVDGLACCALCEARAVAP